MKVLVHYGIWICLSARRLHQGKFVSPKDSAPFSVLPTQSSTHGAQASEVALKALRECRRALHRRVSSGNNDALS